MDSQIERFNYSRLTNEMNVDDKIKYLKTVKANLLARAYVHSLIGNLYIKLYNHSGYANEVVKDELLDNYSYEATSSIIPFFKENDLIIRGLLVDDWSRYFNHSWISFTLHNKEYIFDPALNLIVKKQDYEEIFTPDRIGSVSSYRVKTDLLDTLANGKENQDGFIEVNKSNDINSSFYKADMQIKGEAINRKILTLTTKYNQK
jgi:hypothetical protein